jgi:serine/threonine protein kinase
MDWKDFDCVEHRVDSTSCHIFSAMRGEEAVILKLIKADCSKSPIVNSEFDMEVETLCRIQHQNIVKLLGSGRNPRKFLCLELLTGGSLSHSLGLRAGADKKLSKRNFNYLETLFIARSLAHSLDYLHDKWHSSIHIIHRDLKPDNIGWKDGELKLFDFGLCACVKAKKDKNDHYKLTGIIFYI